MTDVQLKCIEAKYQRREEDAMPSRDVVPSIVVALLIARAKREGR
jgi:hypothetical protein